MRDDDNPMTAAVFRSVLLGAVGIIFIPAAFIPYAIDQTFFSLCLGLMCAAFIVVGIALVIWETLIEARRVQEYMTREAAREEVRHDL